MAEQKKVFFSRQMGLSFYAKIKDEKGNLIPKKDGKGNEILFQGKIQHEEVLLSFTPLSTKPENPWCMFDATNVEKYVLETIEELRKDPLNKIYTQKEYERFDPKKLAKSLEDENVNLNKDKAQLEKTLEEKNRRIAELESRLQSNRNR